MTDKYFDTYQGPVTSWTLTVKNVNRAPSIFMTSPETSDVVEMLETDTKEFVIEKDDPDLDSLTVRWYVNGTEQTDARDQNNFTFNANAPDYDLAGDYLVKALVSDGTDTDEAQWDVQVSNVNRPPVLVEYLPDDDDLEIMEGEEVVFSFSASDPDDNNIYYKWYVNEMVKEQGQGFEDFTFTAAYLASEGYDSSDSPYFIKLEVSDGDLFITTEWKVTVENLNRPPVPVIDRPKEGEMFKVNEKVNFKTSSSMDPDGESLTYVWSFGDRRTDTGAEVDHIFKESGNYQVELEASDGKTTVIAYVNITIVIAKLEIKDLYYEPKEPMEGDTVKIFITIKNNGEVDAQNVHVDFYIGSGGQRTRITDKVIPTIESDGSVTTNASWVAKPGNQVLSASISPDENYLIEGNAEETTQISVKAKPTTTTTSIFDSPYFLMAILAIIIVVVLVAVVAVRRKKAREEEEEEAAVRAIMEEKEKQKKYVPPKKEESVFDQTDFQFGGPVEAVEVPCEVCGKITTNRSGLCNVCSYKKKKRETEETKMECPVCGNEVDKDMFTCPYCHFNFTKMDKEDEEEEEEREPVGYVSDDACADCGVLFNDGMKVRGCPSCDARYHKRCAGRLGHCAECNAELISGPMLSFHALKEEPEPEKEEPEPEKEVPEPEKEVPEPEKEVPEPKEKVPVPTKEEVEPEFPSCPQCGEEIEADWKVCPNCDTRLGEAPVKKVVVKKTPPPKKKVKEEPPPPEKEEEPEPKTEVVTKCPKCGEDVEPDWKVCPACDSKLYEAPKPEKKKITWSKKAKAKVKKVEKKAPPPKKEPVDEQAALKKELDELNERISKANKDEKNVKKAKSLATLAGSFLKGKKMDKVKIYIDRAKKELDK
jgi:hypothetical protein